MRNIKGGKYKFWYLVGGVLGWILWRVKGKQKKVSLSFDESFDNGIHYIEFYADRMPILHQIFFSLFYKETKAEIRAGNIIKEYASLVHQAAKDFEVNPIIVGAVRTTLGPKGMDKMLV
ncbi:hypothetical protein L6248_02290, partial [Candidatus Parcubacteria bacterium]|nr:hypothetical protein [Candidatus Parcubacteria bacterium]